MEGFVDGSVESGLLDLVGFVGDGGQELTLVWSPLAAILFAGVRLLEYWHKIEGELQQN